MDLLGSGRDLLQELFCSKLTMAARNDIDIRRFEPDDAPAVSDLICRTLREVNSLDYPADEIERVCRRYQPDDLLDLGLSSHLYVAKRCGRLVGCAAIEPEDNSSCHIVAVFVNPDLQGQHIGKALMAALEQDKWAQTCKSLTLDASQTALGFYLKLGYVPVKGFGQPDSRGLYALVKAI